MSRQRQVFLFFVMVLVGLCSCESKSKDKPKEGNESNKTYNYAENETGDSITYFKSFDLYTFTGKDKLSVDQVSLPFVKLVYNGEQMKMTAYYSNGSNHTVSFAKLNGYWTTHTWHKGEGVMSHFYTMYTGKGAFAFQFHGDPYVTKAYFFSLTVWQTKNDSVQQRYYQSFNWAIGVDYDSVPSLPLIKEDEIRKNAETYYLFSHFITTDSMGYISHFSGQRIMVDVLQENSFFYTRFKRLRNGNLSKL